LEQKQLIFIFLFALILTSVVGAYKTGENVPLSHSVRLGGAPTTGASCNITATNPIGDTIISFQPMTPNTATQQYNYTISGSLTNITGTYLYDITCVESPLNATDSFTFEITNSGKDFTVGQAILYIFLLILSIGVFTLFIWLFINVRVKERMDINGEMFEFKVNRHIKIFLGAMCYMLFVWLLYLTWNISHTYLELSVGSNFFYPLFRIALALMWPLMVGAVIFGVVSFMTDKKMNEKIQRGDFFFKDGR
jgi:hypothetical protein